MNAPFLTWLVMESLGFVIYFAFGAGVMWLVLH